MVYMVTFTINIPHFLLAYIPAPWILWVKVVTYASVIFLCRKLCAVGKSMIYMSFLLDESIVCGIDFSNTLQGHTCF